jgi:hypothetical protein
MKLADLIELQKLWGTLTPEERAQITSVERTTHYTTTPNEDMVWQALRNVTRTPIGLDRFIKTYGAKNFRERVGELLSYAQPAREVLNNPPQFETLIARLLEALVARMNADNEWRDKKIPITPTTVLNNFALLKSAVDDAYPGYIKAGRMHMIAR